MGIWYYYENSLPLRDWKVAQCVEYLLLHKCGNVGVEPRNHIKVCTKPVCNPTAWAGTHRKYIPFHVNSMRDLYFQMEW